MSYPDKFALGESFESKTKVTVLLPQTWVNISGLLRLTNITTLLPIFFAKLDENLVKNCVY